MTWITEEGKAHNKRLQDRWDRTVPVKPGQMWRNKKCHFHVRIDIVNAKLYCTGVMPDEPDFTKPHSISGQCSFGGYGCGYEDFLDAFVLVSDPRVKVGHWWKCNAMMKEGTGIVRIVNAGADVTYKWRGGLHCTMSNLAFLNRFKLYAGIRHGFLMKG